LLHHLPAPTAYCISLQGGRLPVISEGNVVHTPNGRFVAVAVEPTGYAQLTTDSELCLDTVRVLTVGFSKYLPPPSVRVFGGALFWR
jgi:hypothetical protein